MLRICLIGSLRFYRKMLDISNLLTNKGAIVYIPFPGKYRSLRNPGEYCDNYTQIQPAEKAKDDLERVEAHISRIRESDVVLLIDPEGYIGYHTLGEIYVAHENNKPIFAFEPVCESAPQVVNAWIRRTVSFNELETFFDQSNTVSAFTDHVLQTS